MQERSREIYKVTLVGSVVNVALLLFKFVAGIMGHSAAMIADAIHSLSDFVTDVIVLVFIRISDKPRDKSHDYGHGKYETLAMTLIGMALLVVAAGILYSGTTKILQWLEGAQLEAPGMLALWAALLSILLKEAVYRYSMVKARHYDCSFHAGSPTIFKNSPARGAATSMILSFPVRAPEASFRPTGWINSIILACKQMEPSLLERLAPYLRSPLIGHPIDESWHLI